MFPFILGKYGGVRILDHRVGTCLTSAEAAKLSSRAGRQSGHLISTSHLTSQNEPPTALLPRDYTTSLWVSGGWSDFRSHVGPGQRQMRDVERCPHGLMPNIFSAPLQTSQGLYAEKFRDVPNVLMKAGLWSRTEGKVVSNC